MKRLREAVGKLVSESLKPLNNLAEQRERQVETLQEICWELQRLNENLTAIAERALS